MHMKSFLFCCLGLLISAVAIGQKSFPEATVYALDGQKIDLKEYVSNDKVKIISIWATWCAPCKKELDAIAEIYEDWQADYNVELIAISIDTRRALAKVAPLVASKGWEYTIFTDPNNVLRNSLQFQTIPQTFLVDQKGQIVYSHNGYVSGDEYELEDEIKAIAGQ